MIRVTPDAHQKLRVLAHINCTSMTTMVSRIVDVYVESGMDVEDQGFMWRIMSEQVKRARNEEKQNG